MEPINYLDLFSGIGGFHKGIIQAGISLNYTGFSEIDKYAKSIYKYHFKKSEDLGDINGIFQKHLPKIDIITFGFPCQDLSVSGKRRGIRASKSSLFFEAMRIIRFTRPKYFIFENVKGLFSSNEGRDFITVLEEIAESGYDGQWQLLNTRWVLPQNRERVYFIGYPREASRSEIFPITERDTTSYQNRTFQASIVSSRNQEKEIKNSKEKIENQDSMVSFTLHTTYGQQRGGLFVVNTLIQVDHIGKNKKSQTGRVYSSSGISKCLSTLDFNLGCDSGLYDVGDRVRKLTPIECERLQGFDDDFTKYGVDENNEIIEISNVQRYKVLGNAVTVDIVELIMRKLKKYL